MNVSSHMHGRCVFDIWFKNLYQFVINFSYSDNNKTRNNFVNFFLINTKKLGQLPGDMMAYTEFFSLTDLF